MVTSALEKFCTVTRSITIDTAEVPLHIVTTQCAVRVPSASAPICAEATGCGIATTRDLAELKAQAECLEAFHYLRPTSSPANKVTGQPVSILLPLEGQTVGAELSTLRAWPAVNIRTRERLLIPQQLVFAEIPDQEPRIRKESNSSGTAFGPAGTDRAARSGVLELVERDAVFGAWLSQRRLPILRPAEQAVAGHLEDTLIRSVQSLGVQTLFLDATSDIGLPTAICVCSREDRQLSFGTACAVTMSEAVDKSLLEAMQIRPFLEECSTESFAQSLMDRDIRSYNATDTAYYWWLKGSLADIDGIVAAPSSKVHARPHAVQDTFAEISRHLLNMNFDIFVTDLSSDWLAESGWEVVRVLVPALLSAFTRQRHRPDEHRRWGYLGGAPDLPVPFA